MESTHRAAAGLAADPLPAPNRLVRSTETSGRPSRATLPMRRYEVVYLDQSAQITEVTRTAPAHPTFEDAFAAFGHGALVQAENGHVAVEDLLPGDRVFTSEGFLRTLKWRGSLTINPGTQQTRPEMGTMTRITSDALGLGRPSPDLVLGPTARLYHKAHGVRTLTGSDAAFVPARDFIDGIQMIELRPATPVRVHQLGFDDHQKLNVNGIEVESLHPGVAHSLGLRGDLLQSYLSLFPHKRDLEDFGAPRYPRLRLRDLDIFDLT